LNTFHLEIILAIMKGVIAGLLFCFFLIVFGKKKAFKNSKQQVQSIRVKTKADIVIDDKETYRTIAEHVAKLHDPIGVLVSYGKIIPQSIIDLFKPGIINVHPSLLPLYRGPSPIESAILHGDTETGVTIMQLSAGMDAGPIYSQITVPLIDVETAPDLEVQLGELGAQELGLTLPAILNGTVQPTPQNDEIATYCKLLSKEESLLDTQALTAEQAERHVRAYLAFPKTKVTVAGQQIVVTKAHVSTSSSTALDIECADGRFLSVDELIGPSGKAMNAQGFVNGYLK
jgi:methionyl-tRNA formyltransferase